MSEANITLVRRAFEEVASQGKVEVLDEIAAPDFVRYDLAGTPDIAGTENIMRQIGAIPTTR